MERNQRPDAEKQQGERNNTTSKKTRQTSSEKEHRKAVEIIVLIRGRNCGKTIEKCLRSIRRQTHPYWSAVISLDAPMDNSVEITRNAIHDDYRFFLIVNNKWLGLCHNMYKIIRQTDRTMKPNNDVVAAVIDADDFISKDAFSMVEREYRKHPDTLITYGSYKKMSRKKRTKISRAYPKSGNVRKLPWRGSHLKTIRWKILKQVKPKWFQYKGKWLEAASDLALMFPCIELAGLKRSRHIHKVIYYWNDNMTKRKRAVQKRCEKILRGKK